MKYYLHDSNSFSDEKISELFIKFGYEGLGLFYTLLEKLALQEKPIKTIVLKSQLKVGKKLEKCWKFMEEIELISSNNGETFNEQLLNFSGKYTIKKEKTAKRISEWRENKKVTKNVTCYESVCNTDKVKESKVKESKVKEEREKIEKVDTFSFKNELMSICQNEKLVNDFLLVRKSKKMVNSETAFNILKKEIEKTGGGADVCLEMAIQFNWGGFKADWYQNKINQSNQQNYGTTTLQQRPNSANQTTGSNTNRLTPEQKRANLQHYAELAARVLQESLPKNVH